MQRSWVVVWGLLSWGGEAGSWNRHGDACLLAGADAIKSSRLIYVIVGASLRRIFQSMPLAPDAWRFSVVLI